VGVLGVLIGRVAPRDANWLRDVRQSTLEIRRLAVRNELERAAYLAYDVLAYEGSNPLVSQARQAVSEWSLKVSHRLVPTPSRHRAEEIRFWVDEQLAQKAPRPEGTAWSTYDTWLNELHAPWWRTVNWIMERAPFEPGDWSDVAGGLIHHIRVAADRRIRRLSAGEEEVLNPDEARYAQWLDRNREAVMGHLLQGMGLWRHPYPLPANSDQMIQDAEFFRQALVARRWLTHSFLTVTEWVWEHGIDAIKRHAYPGWGELLLPSPSQRKTAHRSLAEVLVDDLVAFANVKQRIDGLKLGDVNGFSALLLPLVVALLPGATGAEIVAATIFGALGTMWQLFGRRRSLEGGLPKVVVGNHVISSAVSSILEVGASP
jgi:hypothetical protein